MKKILAIDPGSQQSAWVLWDGSRILTSGIKPNESILFLLSNAEAFRDANLYIEMIGHYGTGMAPGREVYETCIWIGHFECTWGRPSARVLRTSIKAHLCGATRANDSNVRQAVWDRFGGRKAAVGTKKQPGPLYGVVKDIMQAFALALYVSDTESKKEQKLSA